MKKLFTLFLALSFVGPLRAQMVYIPDSAFRQKLTTLGFGSCIVNDSIDSTCTNVHFCYSLNVSQGSITNLQGIQAFSNLNSLECSYNNLGYLPPLPMNLGSLICRNCSLNSLPPLPSPIWQLACDYNNLTILPALPAGLKYLHCGYNHIYNLQPLPDSLIQLYCDSNNLTSFPTFNINLKILEISSNDINTTTDPLFPTSLTSLVCGENNITNFYNLPSGLTSLNCNSNLLYNLPTLPDSLTYLNCDYNKISILPALPAKLQTLSARNDSIVHLPSLPSSLISLNCSDNFIDTMPLLPSGLLDLLCWNSGIESFTNLPQFLRYLNCQQNNLTSLPPIPSSMKILIVIENMISSLQGNFDSISSFICQRNLFTTLPDLPDSIVSLDCSENPNLTCLPEFRYINSLNINFTSILCLPGYGYIGNCVPSLSNFPLCDIFNTNGCDFFWNIGGKTYFDNNSNCNQESNDAGMKNMHLNLYENGNLVQQAFTGAEGYYSFDVNNFGNYSVELDTNNIPFVSVCPSTNNYLDTVTASDSIFNGNDFAMRCKNGYDVGTWAINADQFRPGRMSNVYFSVGDLSTFYGVHCAAGISGTVTITINGNVQFDSILPGTFTPIVSGNVLTYNIADFGQVNFGVFGVRFSVPTSAIPGTQICFDVNAIPTSGDYNTSNNQFTYCVTVVGSYDPNFKEVYPEGQIDSSLDWLTYTLHFQNTGNAPAENIYLIDSIDSDLDISSFQLLSMSHNCYAQVLEGGIARFNFPNINLPDSTNNEPMSHGYVQYKIRLKNNLAPATQIKNTAYISFDLNSPVVTNTTLNTISLPNTISNLNLPRNISVIPSPFDEYFYLYSDINSMNTNFKIFNSLGKVILEDALHDSSMRINTKEWPAGIYFVRFSSGNNCLKIIRK